jgi:two-component system cell cycle sensor histidine kinase/response regulator CckA
MTMDSPEKTARIMKYGYILVFIVLAAGIVASGFFLYRDYHRKFRVGIEHQLSAVAELKVNELVAWRADRLADASIFFRNASFSRLVRQFLEKPKDSAARDELRIWLSHYQAAYEYDKLFFLDDQGVERISVPAESGSAAALLMERAPEFRRLDRVTFVDFHRDAPDGPVHLSILVPIVDDRADTRALGILVLRIDPKIYLYSFIRRWPMPSQTAEALIVRRDENDALFLNELKFQKNTALNLRIPLRSQNVLAVKAALGQEGLAEGVDYRGVPVLGALRAVPDSPWSLVARMDVAEAFAPLRERALVTILLIASLLLGAGGGIGFIWRHQRARFYRERYHASETQRASSLRQAALLSAVPDIIMEVDRNKVYTWANSAGFQFFGEDVIGKEAAFYFEGEQDTYQTVKPLFDGHGGLIYVESWQRRKDGEKRLLAWWCRVLKDENGRVTGALSSAHDITERELAAAALRESERKFRDTVSHLDEGYYSCTTDGLLLDHNAAFNRILGFDPAENMKGTKLPDFWQNAEDRRDYLNEFMARGSIRNFLIKAKKASGEKIVVLTNSHLVKDEKDRPVRIEGTFTDFTERTRAEEALHRSETKFREFFENAQVGMYRTKIDGSAFLDVNAKFADIIGFSREELLGSPGHIRWADSEERDRMLKLLKDQGGSLSNYEARVLAKNGDVIHVLASIKLDPDEGSLVGTMVDLTERKRAQQALRESEEKFSKAFQTSPYAITITRAEDGTLVEINDAFTSMTGVTREEALAGSSIGLKLWVNEEDRHHVIAALRAGRPVVGQEFLFRIKSGDVITGLFSAQTILLGDETCVLSSINDISERKRAEEALRQKVEELRARNDELDRFNRAAVGRELRMIELKQDINELCRRAGEPPRHAMDQLQTDSVPGTGPGPAPPGKGGT